jgi:hypothetical protein
MRNVTAMLFAALYSCSIVWSQPKTITGKIIDENGAPVPFVTINIKNSKSHVADANGIFHAQAKTGDTLEFNAINFQPKEVILNAESNLIITLARISKLLTEVIVTTAFDYKKKTTNSST